MAYRGPARPNMRHTNSTSQHHPPRTPSTLSRSITSTTTTSTSTPRPPPTRPSLANASPRVSLPPATSTPRRAASTLGLTDAPQRPVPSLSSAASASSLSSIASTSRAARPFPLAAAPASDTAGTPRLALRARDRNAALSSRPATPRFLKPPLPPTTTTSTTARSTLSALSSIRTPSPSPAMGYDKDTPRKPTLASRPITRAPLTPKIAGAASTTPSSAGRPGTAHGHSSPYQTVTVSTPLARRATGLSASSSTTHNNYDSANSPVPSYLNNVTPRSGSRQSRVDSTPPTGPPLSSSLGLGIGASTNAVSADPDSKFFYASEAKSSSTSVASSSIGMSSASSAMGPPLASPGLAGPSSRPAATFFYANGKSLPLNTGGTSPASPSVASLPLHHPPPSLASPTLTSAGSAGSAGSGASKFVHANGAALERTPSSSSSARPAPPVTPTAQQTSRPLSPVKMIAVAPYPLQKSMSFPVTAPSSSASAAGSSVNGNSAHRPSVPNMPNTLSLNAAALSSAAVNSPAVASPTATQPVSPGSVRLDMLSRQRSNFGASVGSSSGVGGHARKGSLTIAAPPTVARLLQSSQPGSEVPSPASGQFPAYPFPSVTSTDSASPSVNAAAPTDGLARDDDADEGDGSVKSHGDGEGDGSEHTGSSGGKDSRRSSTNVSAHPADQQHSHSQVDELVAMARRERKVQDLEITNASLEAINRSLERQLRKQQAELRQFRRLSRSGRLSLAPVAGDAGSAPGSAPGTAPGSRIASSSTVEGPIQDMDRLLGEDESFDFDEYDSDMDNSCSEQDHGCDSDRDLDLDDERLTRRKRDERRLQLDLAQHRQLLVDSQKINQSIKRCMNWTEALIQEGQKALAFQVRVSEVQLGGRVLAAHEVEEREEEQRAETRRHSQHLEERARSVKLLEETQALLDADDADDADDAERTECVEDNLTERSEDVVLAERSEDVQNPTERSDVKNPTERSEDNTPTERSEDKNTAETDAPTLDALDSTSTSASATPTSTASSASGEHDDQDDRNETFSPVSHNARTVRFDDATEIKSNGPSGLVSVSASTAPVASLNAVATISSPDTSSLTDTAPSTPSKQPLAAVPTPIPDAAAAAGITTTTTTATTT